MDTLAIQRSLTILEDRYRELREIGEKHRQAWQAEESSLRENLSDVRGEKEGLEKELGDVRGEKEGLEKELGDVRGEKEGLQKELGDVRGEKEGLQKELIDAREESELLLLQLHQVQEELEYYFLENQRKEEKLHWLRGQREVLLRMLRLHGRFQQRFLALDGRIALPSLRRQLMPWWQRLQRS
ncbi:hypothetical protein KBY75_03385 [Cyanobium sp. T1G-Tous]|uniref:hypothetical protein n=1 Tax=Cyanobium sp. T1G-Tous TaxID=2823722 RepID=UPI0020CE6AE5|nr:hypothetical protein [Cyanobium sp. T1G-Tous]MCP9802607.1 hypothetical protein [Cyanobium sp. T1G-Tous]